MMNFEPVDIESHFCTKILGRDYFLPMQNLYKRLKYSLLNSWKWLPQCKEIQ